jgi:hypothetical protein
MTTIDAILHCDSDVELYELLNVYIDAVHLAEHTDGAAPYPLANALDVMQAMRALFIALGLVSRRLNDGSRIAIKEALCVFHVALDRLHSLAVAREHTKPPRGTRRGCVDSAYSSQQYCRRLDKHFPCSVA